MKFSRTLPTFFGLALMGVAFSPIAKADAFDKKTEITFSAPVEIPAVHQLGSDVLPAGTYMCKITTRLSRLAWSSTIAGACGRNSGM